MIYEIEESLRHDDSGLIEAGSEIAFRNSRNTSRFVAFASETEGRWIITRQGGPHTPGDYTAETWGFAEQDGDAWIAYLGNLPSTHGQPCRTRDEAFDRVTNVPDGDRSADVR